MTNIAIADPLRARDFAAVGHGHQTYNAEVPYTRHLDSVVGVLQRFGFNEPELLCAGSCHDLIEDTNVSYNDINSRLGEKVAELVYAVTSELGRNRKERNEKTYPKIFGRFYPTALKLADRIANVEYGAATGGKSGMYKKEYKGFREALFFSHDDVVPYESGWSMSYSCDIIPDPADMRVQRMWDHLDSLLGSKE